MNYTQSSDERMDYYQIGQRIRRCRNAKGLSQEQLAERVWISQTHMSHIETGNTRLSLPVLVDIARVLEVSTDDLLSDRAIEAGAACHEINEVIGSCTPKQLRILSDILKASKMALDKFDTP